MGRYRPPQPRSSPYITADGYQALLAEEKSIWQFRKEVTAAVSAAAAEGDRSENAEYIYRKKQLREIDRRIRYLQTRIPELKIVEAVGNREQIFFGAFVELLDEADTSIRYRIVGSDEIDTDGGKISIDSPGAQALRKKKVGDEIQVQLGDEQRCYEVLSIEYAPPEG